MPLLAALLALAPWKTYPLGGVVVDLPAAPHTLDKDLRQQTWRVDGSGAGEIATVSVTKMPTLDLPDLTLAMSAQGCADGYHGRLVEQHDLAVNGWPGVAGRVESDGVPAVRFQAYRVKGLLVFVFSTLNDKDTDRLFASVAFAARFGKGAQAQAGPVWKAARLGKLSVDLPGGPSVDEDRLTGGYGNRAYVLAVSHDSPQEALEAARKAASAKTIHRQQGRLGEAPSERIEATYQDGRMILLAASVRVDGQTVTLVATVPVALQASSEVKRFFGSFHAEP